MDSPTLTEIFKKGITKGRFDVLPLSDYPFSGHNEKKKNFIMLLNSARKELGLGPYPYGEK